MEVVIEKECSALGGLFQTLIADMKSGYPIWEDFIAKAGKLQSQIRATVVAVAAFLDAFQKVADLATNSRGGTRDIGSALTRMCMRHRSVEAKLKHFSMVFMEGLVGPLQEQMEEWKRGVNSLDKDHAREYKKARQEIKKKSSDTLKLQKKAKKGRGDFQPQLDSAMQDVSDKYILLEETEKQALRKALIEERQRFCYFVALLQPVVDEEISMLGEVTHLQAISDELKALTIDPHKLPAASEQVILDMKGSDFCWSYQTPPSSPSSTVSRKSSMCSSLNSVNSSDSRGSTGSHSHSPSSSSSSSSSHLFHLHHPRHRYRSSTLPQPTPARLSSISSHDSGFMSSSHDQHTSSKSSSPMPAETKLSNGFDHCSPTSSPYMHSNGSGTAFPFQPPSSPTPTSSPSRSWSRPTSALLPDIPHYCTLGSPMMPSSRVPSWKDWAKPGPYDQPMVNTLRRKKNKDVPSVVDFNGTHSVSSDNGSTSTLVSSSSSATAPPQTLNHCSSVEETSRGTLSSQIKSDDFVPHEELAMALSRGLELDTQRSSRDSMQCSSGYSTQTNTPCCSEDTIPSQVSDYDYFSMAGDQEAEQADYDKSSTIPRNSDISQSYKRMFQTKRPASTAGLPSTQPPYPGPGSYTAGGYPATPIHSGQYQSSPNGNYPSLPSVPSNQAYYSGSNGHNGTYSSGHGPVIVTPGVATIRRTPSSKPSARRSASGAGNGPIPIRTPVVPVKIPTVPDMTATINGNRSPEDQERGRGEVTPEYPMYTREEATPLQMESWSGQASTNPPAPAFGNQQYLQNQIAPEGGAEELIAESSEIEGNMLVAIRKGVKLKRTLTNDRSAPRIA